MPPGRELEELWMKRKHIFFESEPAHWLQIVETDAEMDANDDNGKPKPKVHFENLSPLKLYKEIKQELNPIEKTTFRLQDGSFNVQVYKSEVELCKTVNKINIKDLDIEIKVIDHPFKNRSRGSVFSFDTIPLSEKEILEELEDQGVTKVVKRARGPETKREYTGELTLTFGCDAKYKPKEVQCAYINMQVREYVPRPLLCYVCFQYGKHLTEQCRSENKLCGYCGQDYHLAHENEKCGRQKKCANCGKDHPTWSRDCGEYKREYKILALKEEKNISYKMATRIINESKSSNNMAGSVRESAGFNDKVWEERMRKNLDSLESKLDGRFDSKLDKMASEIYGRLEQNFMERLNQMTEQFHITIQNIMGDISNEVTKQVFNLIPSGVPGYQAAPITPLESHTRPMEVNNSVVLRNKFSTSSQDYIRSMSSYAAAPPNQQPVQQPAHKRKKETEIHQPKVEEPPDKT